MPAGKKPVKTPLKDKALEVHRDILDKGVDYGGDPDEYPVGQDGWWSESTKEFYYAPGATLTAAPYQDDVTDFPTENGYTTREKDSNFSVKTRPRPTKKNDEDIRVDSKDPSGQREPMSVDVLELGNLTYPLSGALIESAPQKMTKEQEEWMRQREGDPIKYTDTSTSRLPQDPRLIPEGMFPKPKAPKSGAAPAPAAPVNTERNLGEAVQVTLTLEEGKPTPGTLYYSRQKQGKDERAGRVLEVLVGTAPGKPVKEEFSLGLQYGLSSSGSDPYEVYFASEGVDALPEDARAALEELVLAKIPAKFKTQEQQKREKSERLAKTRGEDYNVLTDPLVAEAAPNITDVERLFTPINKWENEPDTVPEGMSEGTGSFTADAEKLDPATLKLIKATPTGEGQYFSWKYLGQEEIQKMTDAEVKETGSAPNIKPYVFVVKTAEWDAAAQRLKKLRDAYVSGEQPQG